MGHLTWKQIGQGVDLDSNAVWAGVNLSFIWLSVFTIVSLYIFGSACLQQTHSLEAKDSWCTALWLCLWKYCTQWGGWGEGGCCRPKAPENGRVLLRIVPAYWEAFPAPLWLSAECCWGPTALQCQWDVESSLCSSIRQAVSVGSA